MTMACRLTWDEARLLTGQAVNWCDRGSAPTPVRIVDVLPGECVLVQLVDNPHGQPRPAHPAELS
ncbi:MAG TPA: hypothetical protein VIC62_15225 [Nakamurella sp.]